MARLLVFWTHPQHLSEDEAEAWASTQLRRLLAAEGIDAARLTRLRSASLHYEKPWDWLLELDVAPARDAHACMDSGAWREWLGDLRLLGMRPAAMVADGGRALGAEDH